MRLADKLSVIVEDESDDSYIRIVLTTPKGLRFKVTDCHSAVSTFDRAQPGEPSNEWAGKMPEGWGACMEDLEFGVEECDNPNCGYCERGKRNE
jgi:hypothetical protein